MINEVIKGITDALYEEFGEKYEIYTEASEQGMTAPAFFVRCVTPDFEKQLESRKKIDLLFAISYFAESTLAPRQELNDVYERLMRCLELIEAQGKKIRGSISWGDAADGILTVMAEYVFFANRQLERQEMQGYEMEGGIRNGISDS